MQTNKYNALPAYQPLFEQDFNIAVIYGGAGSGKSEAVGVFWLYVLLSEDNQKILCTRKTYNSLKDSVYSNLKSLAYRIGIDQWLEFGKAPLSIKCKHNNNEIVFNGLDDVEKLKSITGITGVWIEEASQITKEDFNQLELRVRTPNVKKRIILTFNPISSDLWIKERFFDNKEPNCLIIHTTYKDNFYLEKDYISTLERMAENNPTFYKVYTLGDWGNAQVGQVFKNWAGGIWNDTITSISYGLDFGFSVDPTVLVKIGQINKSDEYYLQEIFREQGLTSKDLIDRLIAYKIDKDSPIYADSSRPEIIEDIRRAGFNIFGSDKSESVGSQLLRLQEKKIFICESPQLAKEFKMYSWKSRNDGRLLQVPIDAFNHGIDAFRYGLQGLRADYNQPKIFKISYRRDF